MKKGETYIADEFVLTPATLKWMDEKEPRVDAKETVAVFTDKAKARGWRYRDWQAAFRNYVRHGKQYGGVVYQQLNESTLRWRELLAKTRAAGFRDPTQGETWDHYTQEFARFERPSQMIFGNVIRKVPV